MISNKRALKRAASGFLTLLLTGCHTSRKYDDWTQMEYRNSGSFMQKDSGKISKGEPAAINGKIRISSTGKRAKFASIVSKDEFGDDERTVYADNRGIFRDTISREGFMGDVIISSAQYGFVIKSLFIGSSFKSITSILVYRNIQHTS